MMLRFVMSEDFDGNITEIYNNNNGNNSINSKNS